MLSGLPASVRARLAGACYLTIFVVAPSGASSATALNLTATLACDIAIALLFFSLFRAVNRPLALAAMWFRLLFVLVMGLNALNYFGALNLFGQGLSPVAFNKGYGIALAPFGVHLILTGRLILGARFMPHFLGYLAMLAGAAYCLFIWPPLGDALFMPWIVIPGVLGEGSLTLWLLIMGVNSQRWGEQASLQPGAAN